MNHRCLPSQPRCWTGITWGTSATINIIMLIPGNHLEEFCFQVLAEMHLPLVLGYSWLRRHNLHLNWETGEILAWGAGCHWSCLVPTLALRGTVAPAIMSLDLAEGSRAVQRPRRGIQQGPGNYPATAPALQLCK